MEFYNMSDFLRGQSSKLITGLSDEDKLILINKQDDQSKEKIFRKYGFRYKQDKSKKLPNL